MKELIMKLDSSLLEIQPVIEYLSQFNDFSLLNEDIENDNGEISLLLKNELLKIMFLKIMNGKWWSIYRFHSDGTKYEQIDIMIFDEIKESGYNRIIKYSGHIEDSNYSYITCSNFCCLNDKIIKSWQNNRVVPIQKLRQIQYCKDMNLTELVLITDEKNDNIIKKENLKNIRELILKVKK